MKDKLTKPAEDKPKRPPFVACGREERGGAQKPGNGTTCIGGQMIFWAQYQGKVERYAKDCQCLAAWRADVTPSYVGKGPMAELTTGDSKVRAAGGAQ